MTDYRRQVQIVGVAETPLGVVADHNEFSMIMLAAQEALGEAGMTLRDVDGLFATLMGPETTVLLGEYLGIRPRYLDSSDLGGAAWESYLHHAMLAVAAGRCEVALLAFASRQRSLSARSVAIERGPVTLSSQFEEPYGLPMPIGYYAMMAARHMHEFGTTEEQLAEIAVAARQWAMLNPKAWSRTPLTVQEVMASPRICDPLKRRDCCLITDGGGVVVVTNRHRARDAKKRPVLVLGAGESQTHWNLSQMTDMTHTAGVISAREAFGMAGITPADVDFVQPYDSFTITVLLALEDMGFCPKGEGGRFVQDGRLAPGGSLPSMTSGGGLSYNHPGALGVLLLIEAVRQLRGECGDRQLADPRIGVVHGVGGVLSTAATVVLAND